MSKSSAATVTPLPLRSLSSASHVRTRSLSDLRLKLQLIPGLSEGFRESFKGDAGKDMSITNIAAMLILSIAGQPEHKREALTLLIPELTTALIEDPTGRFTTAIQVEIARILDMK